MALFHSILVKMVEMMPVKMVWIFSRKYIAGESLASAVDLVKELNSKGIVATMDVLGESISTKEEATKAKERAMQVLEIINKEKLDANLSIKPTQLGLAIDPEFAYELVKELAKSAKELDNFVRIDMEDSPYTDTTINLYKKIYEEFDNVGIVLQAYLKRTYNDAIVLNKIGTNYRLCKGIYVEPATIAYKEKNAIRENYTKTLEAMLKNGNYVGIATHDKPLIDSAYKLISELNIPKNKFEFQMLLGVREDLRDKN